LPGLQHTCHTVATSLHDSFMSASSAGLQIMIW